MHEWIALDGVKSTTIPGLAVLEMCIRDRAVAKMLYDTRAAECYIESNNGGRGFARNVERLPVSYTHLLPA